MPSRFSVGKNMTYKTTSILIGSERVNYGSEWIFILLIHNRQETDKISILHRYVKIIILKILINLI